MDVLAKRGERHVHVHDAAVATCIATGQGTHREREEGQGAGHREQREESRGAGHREQREESRGAGHREQREEGQAMNMICALLGGQVASTCTGHAP